jgi:hypothetical protein
MVGYAEVTVLQILNHVCTNYGMAAPTELSVTYGCMNEPYDPNHPIADIYKQIQDAILYDYAGKHLTDAQIINSAYTLLLNPGVLQELYKTW